MDFTQLKRWGALLETLSELSDVERQVVAQGQEPSVFVPDDLLDRWYTSYRGGRGLSSIGLTEEIQAILAEFDYYLDEVIDAVPDDVYDKEGYIRHNTIWQAIREAADWTLARIVEESVPEDPSFSQN